MFFFSHQGKGNDIWREFKSLLIPRESIQKVSMLSSVQVSFPAQNWEGELGMGGEMDT